MTRKSSPRNTERKSQRTNRSNDFPVVLPYSQLFPPSKKLGLWTRKRNFLNHAKGRNWTRGGAGGTVVQPLHCCAFPLNWSKKSWILIQKLLWQFVSSLQTSDNNAFNYTWSSLCCCQHLILCYFFRVATALWFKKRETIRVFGKGVSRVYYGYRSQLKLARNVEVMGRLQSGMDVWMAADGIRILYLERGMQPPSEWVHNIPSLSPFTTPSSIPLALSLPQSPATLQPSPYDTRWELASTSWTPLWKALPRPLKSIKVHQLPLLKEEEEED